MNQSITLQELSGSGLFFFFKKDQRIQLPFSPEMSVWGIKESLAIIHQQGVVSPYFVLAPIGQLDKDTQKKVLSLVPKKFSWKRWLKEQYGRFNKKKTR